MIDFGRPGVVALQQPGGARRGRNGTRPLPDGGRGAGAKAWGLGWPVPFGMARSVGPRLLL